MSASHDRARDLEHVTAKVLGTKRVRRSRFEKAPDVFAVTLATGHTLQAECKTRKRVPKLILDALKQARGYTPDAIPLAVIRQKGGRAIACLDLRILAGLLGLAPLHAPSSQAAMTMSTITIGDVLAESTGEP
jgi:hypothetical protein